MVKNIAKNASHSQLEITTKYMSQKIASEFIKHITKPENKNLLNAIDDKSPKELTELAAKEGFVFTEADLVTEVSKIKSQQAAVNPIVINCHFLSAVAASQGWACR
jgi:predicted transcriptional regulator